MPRSALFRRNIGSSTKKRANAYRKAASTARSVAVDAMRANPKPAPSRRPVNLDTLKAKTFLPVAYPAINNIAQPGNVMDQVARGSQDNERLGHKFRVVALHLKGIYHGSNTGQARWSGYYVVWDSQPNLASATFGQVFAVATGNVNYAFAGLSTSDRFKVLHHKKIASYAFGSATDNSMQVIDDYIKLPSNLVCTCTMGGAGTGGIAERQSGALLLFVYSDTNVIADQPLYQLAHRIYFEDV